jgi:putative addiction module component (TIGR02574 family)
VSSAAKKVLNDALALSEEDRVRVAEALLDSVPGESAAERSAAWRDEVLRRIAEVQRGEVEPEPWSAVKARIDRALGRG